MSGWSARSSHLPPMPTCPPPSTHAPQAERMFVLSFDTEEEQQYCVRKLREAGVQLEEKVGSLTRLTCDWARDCKRACQRVAWYNEERVVNVHWSPIHQRVTPMSQPITFA